MVAWISLLIPFAYLGILVGSLATFSSLYRQRKAAKAASLAPWFEPHTQRNIYLSLLHIDPEQGGAKIPESVCKAALLRRATEDIHRIIAIRNAKQALSTLLQRGSVGDDLWQRFLRAEKEIEEELRDVVNEANAYSEGWGQSVFQSANEIANNQLIRQRMMDMQAQAQSEKEWWEKQKASYQSELMNELEADTPKGAKIMHSGPTSIASTRSDDDAVLVEAGGPSVEKNPQSAAGKGKKKKGKQ